MKRPIICTRIGVFVGTVAFCAGAAFAQQPAPPPAFQPAPPPLQLQQPVQAQPAPPSPAYQPAPQPVQQQPPVVAPPPPPQKEAQDQSGWGAGTSPAPEAPKTGLIDAKSSMRLGVELSAEALAAAPYLYYDNGKRPGVGKVAYPKDHYIYRRFDNVVVKPIGGELPFKNGDTVDVLKYIKNVKVGGERACLVARIARGVVFAFVGDNAVVRLTDMWGKVTGSESVVRATPFIPVYVDNKPAGGGANIGANVILQLDATVAAPYMHQYIVLDKGSEAGVKIGDFFRVVDKERHDRLTEELVEAQVLNVTPKASTLLLQKIYRERLKPGDRAYLSFRAAAKID
ncbi:MAG: hypothetical protein LBC59_01675 [Chitinispirillales bacterium]|nr:hypothetical protein [Chitinispirillales bacterium]